MTPIIVLIILLFSSFINLIVYYCLDVMGIICN